ncbi:MoxR-like ATPase [Microbacterium natoriense]|uniref:MoxR-like ATPase n=1 Tax=Microbacterium natoriense TaxID=284570 RepID=A0AAW8EYT2_9MICO|nr:pore-forming ESAT-6 family protein [Microbacterium natoriense]MDQ0648630.1 MoxR-like ATPase [Microbacterium natoriense]
MAGNQADRRDFDLAASQTAQDNFLAVASRLEALIDQRDADVRTAMSDYDATGVSDDYAAKELRWKNAADGVKAIINTLRQSMAQNDETAQSSLGRAKSSVANIG